MKEKASEVKTKAEEGTLWSDMSTSAQKFATKVCATLGVVLSCTCFYSNMRDFEINFGTIMYIAHVRMYCMSN